MFGVRSGLLSLLAAGSFSTLLLSCQQTVAWPAVKQTIRAEFPGVEQITVESLDDWLVSAGDAPLLLDVRDEAEYRVSHLRGAVRVDPDGVASLPTDTPRDAAIVTYCSVGYRSSALAARLMEQGYTGVRNLEGSIFEWANRGLPVVRDGREVRQVHLYDRIWGKLLDEELRAYSVD